jgi:hypothetical protein
MTEIPEHIKKAMESDERPDMVKRQITEVMRSEDATASRRSHRMSVTL